MKTVEINGVVFQIVKPRTSNYEHYEDLFFMEHRPINVLDCYRRPSQAKLNIWAWWRYWFAELDEDLHGVTFKQFCGISSYNCMQFTLHGLIRFYDKDYIVYITKSYNRLIEVVK